MLPGGKAYSAIKKLFHQALDAVVQSRLMRAFASKFPKAHAFLMERFSLDHFTGLPLTILLVAFAANVFLLSKIVQAFRYSALVQLTDRQFAQWMYELRVPGLIDAFYWFSKLGSFWGVVSIAILSVIGMWWRNKKQFIIPVLVSLLGANYTMSTAKKYFQRIRPEEFWYYHEVDFSFPSGHATISVAFYGALFYAIIRTRRRFVSKFRWIVTAIVFIGLLGYSRLYLCVHYLSDVMAGYSLGLLWLLLGISLVEWGAHRKKRKEKK